MENSIAEIQKEVFLQRPVLAEIGNKFGALSLIDYIRNSWEIPSLAPDPVFLAVLKAESAILYGADMAARLADQLAKKPLTSTIDHLGIWNHPIFVNSSLIFSLAFGQNELVPVLATESVSLNNTTSWSASLLYHNEALEYKRSSFLPDRLKTLPVFSAPAITALDIKHFQKLSKNRFNELLDILNLTDADSFAHQACRCSGRMWQAVFPGAPQLAYLPLETIISKYLLKIFQDPENLITQIVLTKQGRALWAKFFKNEHSFMFWAIGKKGRREAVTELPENSAEILALLEGQKIYPASPLCFVVLLSAGLACAGGFNQTTWLTEVKEKFLKLLKEFSGSFLDEAKKIQAVTTKNFAESSLAWLKLGGQYVAPSALDLYATGKDYYKRYVQLAEQVTLGQSLSLAMPTIYSVVVPKTQWPAGFNAEAVQTEIFKDLGLGGLLDKFTL